MKWQQNGNGPLNKVEDTKDRTPKGLKDGGSRLICCASCKAPLVNIWVTRPDEDTKVTVNKIKCPYCSDSSFKTEIKGGFHYEGTDYTDVAMIEWTNCLNFTVVRGQKKYEK